MQNESFGRSWEQITKWLKAENITFKPLDNSEGNLAIQATLGGYEMLVSEPIGAEGSIAISTGLRLAEEDIELIEKRLSSNWPAFLIQLKLEVSSREIFFTVNSDYKRSDWLSIQRILYSEDMTRTSFMTALRELINTLWRVKALVNLFLATSGENKYVEHSKDFSFVG